MRVMIGIDPHKASHTAVAIDTTETVLDEVEVRASKVQVQRLTAWAERFEERTWAVESAGGLGYLVAQQLVAAGETVLDVPAVLASRVRVLGSGRSQKNDSNDARAVAVAALRSDRMRLVVVEDHCRVLRVLVKRHRDQAQLRAKHCARLHALVLELRPGGISGQISVSKANRLLAGIEPTDEVTRHRVLIAGELVADIARLDETLKASKARIAAAVVVSGTSLCNIVGVGPIVAATILAYTGPVDRFPTPAAFAAYNGTAPVEVSSGGRTRHRLNQRGNRILNHAIHIAAVVQSRCPGEGRVYYGRKIAEGKTPKEAIRALKRRISDRIYRHLNAEANSAPAN